MHRTALLYFDRSDPAGEGWAWRTDAGSGPVSGDLPEGASLAAVLDAASSDLPEEVCYPAARWQPVEHDGPGWTVRVTVL